MNQTRTAARTEAGDRPVDERTVGELLLAADVTVRDASWDSGRVVAKQRVQSWVDVVDAAAALWAAVPDRTRDPAMERIHRIALGVAKTNQRMGWPPADVPPDPHLDSVAADLRRAAHLVSSRRHPTARLSEAGHLDSDATRTRLMHVVSVATHGMRWSLSRYVRDLERIRDARSVIEAGDSFVASRDALNRTAPVEQLSGAYLRGRWPRVLDGEHRDPVPDRLGQAMAGWEVQVRRSLVKAPTPATLLFAASVERQRVLAAEFVIGSAATLRLVDGAEFVNRIKPALETLGVAWARLERDLAPLSGWRRADPDLGRAAEEMRAGLREITHDGAGLASPQTMADRTDLVVASRSLQLGASLGSEVAHAMREAIDEIVWTVPARGASKVHQALGVAPTPVDSASVRTGAVLPLSDVGLRALAAHVDDVARAARTVDSTGSAVHTALQGRPASGREHQERALTYAPGGAPVPGVGPASGPLTARGV